MWLISFSISDAETTLLKLREGSRRDTSFPVESSVDGNICCITSGGSPREEASITDTDSSREYLEDTSSCQPRVSLKEQKKTKFSLAYMFSRYRSSQCAGGINEEDAMDIEDDTCSANSSLSPNSSQSMNSSLQSTIQEHICSQ